VAELDASKALVRSSESDLAEASGCLRQHNGDPQRLEAFYDANRALTEAQARYRQAVAEFNSCSNPRLIT